MRLFSADASFGNRELLLLAPNSDFPKSFANVLVDPSAHEARLAEAQRLRGEIFMEVGAIESSQLSNDGRHIQGADDQSWHLLTLDNDGHVAACARYLSHSRAVHFEDLAVSRTALAQSKDWGGALRDAVEADLHEARRRRCSYVEVGGWAIAQALRCTTTAIRTMASAYAFAQLCGGALGITTANTQSCSAAILKRIGGRRLEHAGTELPIYYDEHYRHELEVLRFDSARPNPRYRKWIRTCRSQLKNATVIYRRAPITREARISNLYPAGLNLTAIADLAS